MPEQAGLKGLILIVDDEPANLRLMQLRLKGIGHEIVMLDSGQKCLEFLKARVPNLILLDYNMPRMNGLEVLAEVRKSYPHVSVVMITAYGSEEVAVGALRAGANDYLTKPINFDELELVVKENIERNRLKTIEEQMRRQLEESSFQLARAHAELEALNVRLVQKLETAGENLSYYTLNTTASIMGYLWRELSSLPEWGRLQGPLTSFIEAQSRRVVSAYPVCPVEMVNQVLDLVRPLAERQGIKMQASVPQLPEVTLKGTYFQWILMSLLVRALKVMPEGGELWLKLARDDKRFTVEVTDTGWPANISQDTLSLTVLSDMGEVHRTIGDETNRILYVQALLTQFLGGQFKIEPLEGDAGTRVVVEFPWIPAQPIES